MASQADFEAAVAAVNKLPSQPGQADQLKLYGLFKQANAGDVSGKKPGRLDIRGRAKYGAWADNSGRSNEEARAAYIALAAKLGAS